MLRWILLAASALLAACAGSCNRARPPAAATMEVVDWPGRDGRKLPLDQPLRLAFLHRLPSNLRAGAIEVLERGQSRNAALDRPVTSLRMEIAGSILLLHPELPRSPDLEDGSLRPGRRYRLLVHGVPRLSAVTSPEAAALIGDRFVEFETLPAESDAEAVLGSSARSNHLLTLDPSRRVVFVGVDGRVRIRVREALDPRSLQEPAVLAPLSEPAADPASERAIPLALVQNDLQEGAWLEAEVGALSGAHRLVLPALTGLAGEQLAPEDRELRLRSAR